MARIKNLNKYNLDNSISLDDMIIGTEKETGKTKNYSVRLMLELFKQKLGL